MNQSNREATPLTEENTRATRFLQLPTCFSSGPASSVVLFCYGLLLGAAGGLLLGKTAVVLLQSLELLADKKQLMDHLNNYMYGWGVSKSFVFGIPLPTVSETMFNSFISIMTEEFCLLCITLSLAVGIPIGIKMYQFVLERRGDTAIGKALALGGPLCLMAVTFNGYLLGFLLEYFLSWTAVLSICTAVLSLAFHFFFRRYFDDILSITLLSPIYTPFILYVLFGFTLVLKSKLLLMIGIILRNVLFLLEPIYLQLSITPVLLTLILTDVFNFGRQPIVTLQSPTNTSNAVVEGIFVGVFTSQMLMVSVGMSLFIFWHKRGAGRICAVAAGLGTAVLAAIESFLPVLGPGPTIGGLMGVAGAAGVSLAAAGVAIDKYGQVETWSRYVRRLGVAIGAGLVAFLYSYKRTGLSGIFIGVCAATVPAEAYWTPLFGFIKRHIRGMISKVFLGVVITISVCTWVYFACALLAEILVMSLIGLIVECTILFGFFYICVGVLKMANKLLDKCQFQLWRMSEEQGNTLVTSQSI